MREGLEVLNVTYVAAALGVCRKTVLRLIGKGDLAAVRIGREYRIDPKELQRLIESKAAN